MTETPCRYCTDRDPYCHCTCQKYIGWKAIREVEKAAIRKDRERYVLTDAQKKAYWASKRRDPYGRNTKKFTG